MQAHHHEGPPEGHQLSARWGSESLGWPSNPYAAYDEARALGPVCRAELRGGRAVWLVTGFAEAKAALGDGRLSTDGRRFVRRFWSAPATAPATGSAAEPEGLDAMSLAEHMLSTDPPDHTRLRRLVSQAFTSSRVEAMRPRVEEIASNLADLLVARLARGEAVDLLEAFAFPLPIRVICELLGVPEGDEARFRHLFRSMIVVGTSDATRSAAQRAALEVADYLAGLLAGKRRDPGDDLVSALVAARDGDQELSEPELMSMVFLLLLAGHETTVNLIGNGMAALLAHPGQLALLRARPELVEAAVEELLRFDGPVQHPTLRFTTEAVEIGGVTIPPGEVVLVVLGAANRDPSRFPHGDRLDLTRDAGGHLGFGQGPHFCLGAPLARMEGRIALGLLTSARFQGLHLAVAPEALEWREGIFLRGLEALPVRFGEAPSA